MAKIKRFLLGAFMKQYVKARTKFDENLQLLPYMASISASSVIALYLSMQIEGRTKVQQRRQQCDRIDEETAPNES